MSTLYNTSILVSIKFNLELSSNLLPALYLPWAAIFCEPVCVGIQLDPRHIPGNRCRLRGSECDPGLGRDSSCRRR